MARIASSLKRYHQKLTNGFAPMLPLIIVTLVSCYWLPVVGKKVGIPRAGGEFYPLSSFPMYSTPQPRAYLVYLVDGEGNEIGSQTAFGVRVSSLTKDYHRELNQLDKKGKSQYDLNAEQKTPAGQDVLEHLVFKRSPERAKQSGLKAVQMVDRRLYLRNGKIEVVEHIVGRVEIPQT